MGARQDPRSERGLGTALRSRFVETRANCLAETLEKGIFEQFAVPAYVEPARNWLRNLTVIWPGTRPDVPEAPRNLSEPAPEPASEPQEPLRNLP